MNTRTLVILLTALAVMAGFAIRAARARAETGQQLAALAAERERVREQTADMQRRLRSASEPFGPAEADPAGKRADSPASNVTATAAAGEAAARPAAPARKFTAASLVANDPVKMAAYVQNYRDSLDLTLGGMFRKLGLSPEQIEKVKDLHTWYEQSLMDLNAAAESQGVFIGGGAYNKLRYEDLAKERNRREVEIFGEGEFLQRYRDLRSPSGGRSSWYLYDTVQRIASVEMGEETPATFAQVERAAEILRSNSLRPATVKKANRQFMWQQVGWSWQDWAAVNWAEAEPQLRRELTPAQYTFLRQLLRTQETWTAVAARNAANQQEASRRVKWGR